MTTLKRRIRFAWSRSSVRRPARRRRVNPNETERIQIKPVDRTPYGAPYMAHPIELMPEDFRR
jgi:hypothetical protein